MSEKKFCNFVVCTHRMFRAWSARGRVDDDFRTPLDFFLRGACGVPVRRDGRRGEPDAGKGGGMSVLTPPPSPTRSRSSESKKSARSSRRSAATSERMVRDMLFAPCISEKKCSSIVAVREIVSHERAIMRPPTRNEIHANTARIAARTVSYPASSTASSFSLPVSFTLSK